MKYFPLILGLAFSIIIIAAFVIDQGGEITTQQQAQTVAQGAARAGTNAASGNAIAGDAFNLAGDAAVTAAQNYVAAAGPQYSGTVQLQGAQIVVTVRTIYQTKLAYWIGVSQIPASGTAAARLIDH